MQRVDVVGLDKPLFFPDGMEQDEMAAAIQKNFPDLFQAAESPADKLFPGSPAQVGQQTAPPWAQPEPKPERPPVSSHDFDESKDVFGTALTEIAKQQAQLFYGFPQAVRKGAIEGTAMGLRGMAESAESQRQSIAEAINPETQRTYNPYSSPLYRAGQSLTEYNTLLDPYIDLTTLHPSMKAFSEGVGTTAPFFALGAFSGPLGWVLPGAFGSYMLRDEFTQDALQNKASPDAVKIAGDIGAIVGISETLPVAAYFSKLEKLPGDVCR